MSRLRIRIELNRGGVGVPLHKLASVVEQAQKFFHMLAEDVHVDQSKGEWLGFEFDRESLNFTAEFVGPVLPEQVSAFHAAFDGSTSLRRATIAQFARITDSIGEDELIGFGLYPKDEGEEPEEWRCLSRRDALRISDEMRLLMEASGEQDQDTRLPAVVNTVNGARWFSERHDRSVEPAKWVNYVREVEANLDRRIGRVEKAIDEQSGMIGDLHSKSTATEDSVRRLLGAVEGFCAQTTRQLEMMSSSTRSEPLLESAPEPVAQAFAPSAEPVPAPTPISAEPAASPAEPVWEHTPAAQAEAPSIAEPKFAAVAAGAFASAPPTTAPQPEAPPKWSNPIESGEDPRPAWEPPAPSRKAPAGSPRKREWDLAVGVALLVIGLVALGIWAWQSSSSQTLQVDAASDPVRSAAPVQTPAAVSKPAPVPPEAAPTTAPITTKTAQAPAQTPAPAPAAAAPGAASSRIDLATAELTWVSLRTSEGKTLVSRVFNPGDSQSLEVPEGGTLRVGNAGGVSISYNGQQIGPLGTHGQVREVLFSGGSYKIGGK